MAADEADVAALEAEIAADAASLFTLVAREDNEIHVPVLVSGSSTVPISRTRPDAT